MEKNNNTINPEEIIEVTWSGKKYLMKRSQLDEWYDQSFEDRDYFIESHPWLSQPIAIHHFRNVKKHPAGKVDLNKYVVVHWGNKSLIFPRDQLDEWYSAGPEEHRDFIQRHPSREIQINE